MPTIAEIRQQYPQYGDMTDDAVAGALHQKYYSDMPRGEFNKKIGLGPDAMTDTVLAATGGIDPASAQDLSKYAADTVKNIPKSAVNMATDIAHVVAHPIDTVEGIGNIGKGVLQKFGVVGGDDSEKYADAVGQFFKDRYGSAENIAKTLKEDPVGAIADVSAILSGGGTAAARAPGVIGKVGKVAAEAGRVVDPLNAVGAVVKPVGKFGAEIVGGLTGTGGKSLTLAAEAGAEGGAKGQAFRDNISGAKPIDAVVADAKGALGQLRAERGAEYRTGMAKVGADTTVLDFSKIDQAVNKVSGVKNFKGQDLSPTTKGIREDITKAIADWKQLPANEFHTAEGLDALKQKIGDIRDGTQYGTPERVIADQIYHGIKSTIVDQAPEYAKIMKGYEEASGIVKEIEKTLSLKPGASIDASVRKLQSVLRNNVSTNYGNRTALADFLVANGAPNLLTQLAGQSLNTWLPRGLGHVSNTGEAMFAIHELMNGNPKAAAAIGALLPLSSPKLMGGAAYGLGVGSRYAKPAAAASFQLGRTDRALQ